MTVKEMRDMLSRFPEEFKVEFGIFGPNQYRYASPFPNAVVGINTKSKTVLIDLDDPDERFEG